MKIKPKRCYLVIKDNRIDLLEVYPDKEIILNKGEKLFEGEIKTVKEIKAVRAVK